MQKWAWPALGVFVLACFYGFWWYGPFDLDEGLYAVALMEMQERGDWVMPTYRGEAFWEKPILVFWTAWIADLLGADGVVALRLPSILATLGTLISVALFTRRIGAVMILSVSVLFMGVGRMFIPDPLLVFGMTVALLSLWKAREDPRWHVAAGLALAAAVLAKGPMPLVVFGLLGVYARWRIGGWARAGWWRIGAITLFLALVLPWYVAAAQRSPDFIQEFLIKQNFGRLTGAGDPIHAGQIWMYIPVVLIGLLPFSLSLVGAWRKREGQLEQYLWAFVWIVFVLFSFSGTKLPHYILPILPALAILIDGYLERTKERHRWEYAILFVVLAVSFFIYGLFLQEGSFGVNAVKLASLTALLGFLGSAALCNFKRGGPQLQGFMAMAPVAVVTLILGPFLYWNQTHADPTRAAILASSYDLPIVEYRTGGERERGKTSHPSIQWWLREATLTAENLASLGNHLRQEGGAIIVISRDGRFREDQRRVAPVVGAVTPIETYGVWEVLRVDAGR